MTADRVRAIVALLALGAGALADRPARADFYEVSDLGALMADGASCGSAVNAQGQVAGWADVTGGRIGVLASGGTLTPLGTLGGFKSWATAINDGGTVVGSSQVPLGLNTTTHAFQLDPGGSMRDLGSLGGNYSEAFGVNDQGVVVGQSRTLTGQLHAFAAQNGEMSDIGGLLGNSSSSATAISNSGVIVGSFTNRFGAQHAFRFGSNGVEDLGTLVGGSNSYATAVNLAGQVVGVADDSGGGSHAFRTIDWQGRTVIQNLGTLPGGGDTAAYGISDSGLIVGAARIGSAWHAFLFDPTRDRDPMQDLNALIAPDTGWSLSQAYGISGNGYITGIGTLNGQQHAFLLRPSGLGAVPGPPAMALLALGGLGSILGRRFAFPR